MKFIARSASVLFLLLFAACSSGSAEVDSDSIVDSSRGVNIIPAEDSLNSMPIEVYERDSFLFDSFLVLVDSFFSAYAGREVGTHHAMNIMSTKDHPNFWDSVLLQDKRSVRRIYHISSEAVEGFSVRAVSCPDSTAANKTWKGIQDFSGPVNATVGDKQPCLTYTGDYVFRTGNRVFWLATGCAWSREHQDFLARLLKRTIYDCSVKNEIKCRCGGMKPERN